MSDEQMIKELTRAGFRVEMMPVVIAREEQFWNGQSTCAEKHIPLNEAYDRFKRGQRVIDAIGDCFSK